MFDGHIIVYLYKKKKKSARCFKCSGSSTWAGGLSEQDSEEKFTAKREQVTRDWRTLRNETNLTIVSESHSDMDIHVG